MLVRWAFDPYPFIFLNLLLSMLAALQAPVIMMSQNRQAEKDRLAAALGCEVNVKAESAIAELSDVDRLMQLVSGLIATRRSGTFPWRWRTTRCRPSRRGRDALARGRVLQCEPPSDVWPPVLERSICAA